MVKDSAGHSQVVCWWFAHLLGICESAQPLNSLSRLKSRHNGPRLGLIHSESNWRDVENVVDTLGTQFDLNSLHSGQYWFSKPISHPGIKSPHQSWEDWLRNCHNWQPSHPTEWSLKPEVLKLGEIDTSPRDDFPLGELLLVALIIFNRTEKGRVIPRLSGSLRLLRLIWLNRALALSPGGARFSPWWHPMNENEKEESKKREWNETRRSNHKPEALGAQRWSWTNPEESGAEKKHSQKLKPWVSNQNPNLKASQNQVHSLQSVRNLAKTVFWK